MKNHIENMKVALAGSVGSSLCTLQGLIRHNLNIVGVLGLARENSVNVSGYVNLCKYADKEGIPSYSFTNINDKSIINMLHKWELDILFVVGLSQIVKKELLDIPRLGCIGFHPTCLPQGRGRAPIAWLILEGRPGAATFFLMNEDVDSGPILVQEPFDIFPDAYANDVVQSMNLAIERALDRWLPRLKRGEWNTIPQEENNADYRGVRRPKDGIIDWSKSANEILTLIRAASSPHPGAYTYLRQNKLVIWRADIVKFSNYRGVVGRVLQIDKNGYPEIQTGNGVLRLLEYNILQKDGKLIRSLKAGDKLGIAVEDEIIKLKNIVSELENKVTELYFLLKEKGIPA